MSLEKINSEIIIRQMSEDDIQIVKHLELVCGLSFWSVEDYRTSLNNLDYIMLIAQYYKNVIGFSVARLIMIQASQSNFEDCKNTFEVEVYNIAIDAKYRRQGIGRAMLERCLSSLNTPSRVIFRLEVRKSNAEAIEFYSRLGFSIQGIRKQFYRDPFEDGLAMSLEKIYKP